MEAVGLGALLELLWGTNLPRAEKRFLANAAVARAQAGVGPKRSCSVAEVLGEQQRVLRAAAKAVGHNSLGIGEVKGLLRTQGEEGKALAARLGRFNKGRNALAHSYLSLAEEVAALLAREAFTSEKEQGALTKEQVGLAMIGLAVGGGGCRSPPVDYATEDKEKKQKQVKETLKEQEEHTQGLNLEQMVRNVQALQKEIDGLQDRFRALDEEQVEAKGVVEKNQGMVLAKLEAIEEELHVGTKVKIAGLQDRVRTIDDEPVVVKGEIDKRRRMVMTKLEAFEAELHVDTRVKIAGLQDLVRAIGKEQRVVKDVIDKTRVMVMAQLEAKVNTMKEQFEGLEGLLVDLHTRVMDLEPVKGKGVEKG